MTCSFEGCERPIRARGWCVTHWSRWHRHGTPELATYSEICETEGCVRPVRSKRAGLCETHYYRMRRTGSTSDPVRISGRCLVADCQSEAKCGGKKFGTGAEGYCRMHYLRIITHGDPHREYQGPNHAGWTGEDVTNRGLHQRIHKARGKASEYACADCTRPARHWSYDHSDPNEKHDPEKGPYSPDINRYEPRCVRCHKRFDLAFIAQRREVTA